MPIWKQSSSELDLEAAQRHFEKSLALDSELFAALKGLGDVHEARGNWEKAVEHMLRAEGVIVVGTRIRRWREVRVVPVPARRNPGNPAAPRSVSTWRHR